ncbi:MAG: DUF1700 domain-containing protein [Sarcina sp.]
MSKIKFMSTLSELLTPLNQDDRDKFLDYYEEMIEDYKETGLSEEEIFKKLGNPRDIARNILREHDIVDIKMPSNNKTINTILLILGFPLWGSLLFAGAALVFSFYIVIWCLPFITSVTSISLLGASIFSIIGVPFMMADTLSVGVVQLGIATSSFGFSILLWLITIPIYKHLLKFTKDVTKKLISVFTGRLIKI